MLDKLTVQIYADGADLETAAELAELPHIKGFTTNPTLMRKAGVENYEKFARAFLDATGNKPVSFEVITDDLEEMERQARLISSWNPERIFVKIPITNTKGRLTIDICRGLALSGVQINVTAVFTIGQTRLLDEALIGVATPCIVSIFAGRIANTGRNASVLVAACRNFLKPDPMVLWASPRQVYDVVQADRVADIITLTPDLIGQLHLLGKDLSEYSLETVQMFYDDAQAAGYTL